MHNQTNRLIILLLSVLSGACNTGHKNPTPQAGELPNIVIIVSDDQGYPDVSFHEHPEEVSTTAIDELAYSGVVFTSFCRGMEMKFHFLTLAFLPGKSKNGLRLLFDLYKKNLIGSVLREAQGFQFFTVIRVCGVLKAGNEIYCMLMSSLA